MYVCMIVCLPQLLVYGRANAAVIRQPVLGVPTPNATVKSYYYAQ